MRDTKIKAFYYPDMWTAEATLKKAILPFDELHFMERPSFSFPKSQSGLIGAASPFLRSRDLI
jgi:hypothetical protein